MKYKISLSLLLRKKQKRKSSALHKKKKKKISSSKSFKFHFPQRQKSAFSAGLFSIEMKMEFISTANLATRNPALNKPIESRYERENVFTYSISASAARKEWNENNNKCIINGLCDLPFHFCINEYYWTLFLIFHPPAQYKRISSKIRWQRLYKVLIKTETEI